MAHSNRKTKREQKRTRKAAMKAANRARNAAGTKRLSNARKKRQLGHPHLQACGNIGCLRDSAAARKGYLYLLSKSVGPAKAKERAEKLGWIVE